MLERDRSRGFRVRNTFTTIRNVLLQSIKCRFDQILLARFVFFLAHVVPVREIRVGTGDDQSTRLFIRSRVGVVERKRAAGDVATEQQICLKSVGGTGEQQISRFPRHGFAFVHRHVNLRAGVIQTNSIGVVNERAIEMFFADHVKDRRTQVRV